MAAPSNISLIQREAVRTLIEQNPFQLAELMAHPGEGCWLRAAGLEVLKMAGWSEAKVTMLCVDLLLAEVDGGPA